MQIVLDTIYKVQQFKNRIQNGNATFEFATGTLEVYVSDKVTKPANQSEMSASGYGTYSAGLHGMRNKPIWILWTKLGGNPVVNENNIIETT